MRTCRECGSVSGTLTNGYCSFCAPQPEPTYRPIGRVVLSAVAEAADIPLKVMRGRRRERRFVLARWAVMHVLAESQWSLPQIGRLLARDHTTVLHGLRASRMALRGQDGEHLNNLIEVGFEAARGTDIPRYSGPPIAMVWGEPGTAYARR